MLDGDVGVSIGRMVAHKRWALAAGPVLAAAVGGGLYAAGLSPAACWCAAVTALCAAWWIFEPIAIPATSGIGRDRKFEERYSEPHRHYHTLDHVRDLLEGIDLAVDYYDLGQDDERALHTIAWFHDVIYDPTAPSGKNEIDSAQFFLRHSVADVPGPLADCIYEIIWGTTWHRIKDGSTTFLGTLFFDLDLRGLATNYGENGMNVRKEFSHLSDEEWRVGRLKFLESMRRRNIFFTSLFGPLEADAKMNIEIEYQELKGLV